MSALPFPAAKYALTPQRQQPHKKKQPAPQAVSNDTGAAAAAPDPELRLKRKIDQASRVLDALEKRDSRLAAAIRELQKRRSAAAARIERIEHQVLTEMVAAGFDSALGMRREFRTKACPPALEIRDLSQIPPEYLRETVTTAADKVQIKAALQRGLEIPGCALTSRLGLNRK